jgi:hypothetical protein
VKLVGHLFDLWPKFFSSVGSKLFPSPSDQLMNSLFEVRQLHDEILNHTPAR